MERTKKKRRAKSVEIDGERFTFRADLASRAVKFCESFCRHAKGELAGQTIVLEPWQREIVEEMFGWVREDGTRRYREAYISMARKNGKTTLIAAIGLYLLIADGEPGAEVYAAAADRENARILFDQASHCVATDPVLSKRCTVFKHSILNPSGPGSLKVLSSEAYTKHGLNGHGILLDELHAHHDGELYDVLTTSVGARRQPLTISITTAGVFDDTHICWKRYSYAKRVARDPAVDPHFLPVVYETDPAEDWHDPEVWKKANPGLEGGKLVRMQYLQEEHKKAIEDPSLENRFRRLHLNQWTEQLNRWIPMDRWKACEVRDPPIDLRTSPCVLGVDLSLSTDLSAVVAVTPYKTGDDWGVYVEPYFWLPRENVAARERSDHADYSLWHKRGLMTLIDGPVIDDTWIEKTIRDLCASRKVRAICFDPYAAAGVASRLEKERLPVVFVKQSVPQIAPAAKVFYRLVTSGTLLHSGHSVLDYCAANVAVKDDKNGNIYPVKSRSRGRIDGISATITALSHVMLDPLPKPKKVGDVVTIL